MNASFASQEGLNKADALSHAQLLLESAADTTSMRIFKGSGMIELCNSSDTHAAAGDNGTEASSRRNRTPCPHSRQKDTKKTSTNLSLEEQNN